MLLSREVTLFSTCSWIGMNSRSCRGTVKSVGTVCGVSLGKGEAPRDHRDHSRGEMRCSFWGVAVESSDGTMASTRRCDVGLVIGLRAQRSRFFKKYSRSSQDQIEILVKSLCSSKESAAVTLDENTTWMKPPDWFNVLDGIGRRRRWLLALEVFRWIQIQKWYKVDNGYYSKLISIMGKERQYRMAITMFKEMKRTGCRPDTSLYNSIMTVFLRSEDKEEGFVKAMSLLEEMKLVRRCQPNIVTYNILTRAAAQMGDQNKVNYLFKEIFNRDLSPDDFTFNGIMDAYGKAGNIVMMEVIFKRMREEKVKPDIVTFNLLIDAYGKAREFEKMEQVFWSMTLKRTPPILPIAKTFNSIITNYGNAGLTEKLGSVLGEMKNVKLSPTFVTYECLIGAYGQSGQFDKMRYCVKKMEAVGFKPQSSTLNKVLEKYCIHGMVAEAEELLDNSVAEWGVEATSLSYGIVIRSHKKAGNRSQVQALLDKMKLAGVKPTRDTYLDVMELIGIEVDYHKAQGNEDAGTVKDLDEMSSLRTEEYPSRQVLTHVEDTVGAAA